MRFEREGRLHGCRHKIIGIRQQKFWRGIARGINNEDIKLNIDQNVKKSF